MFFLRRVLLYIFFFCVSSAFGTFLSAVLLFTGNPDDSNDSLHASRAVRDGPDRAGAIQQDPVQSTTRRQQQLPQTVRQMSSRSEPGARTDCQAPGTNWCTKWSSGRVSYTDAHEPQSSLTDGCLTPSVLTLVYRCTKKQAQTSTRWPTSELGSASETLCRRRSVAPPTRRPCSSHSTGPLFLLSQWPLTEVWFTFLMKSKLTSNFKTSLLCLVLKVSKKSVPLMFVYMKGYFTTMNSCFMFLNND